jgi:protein-S-isoprenylcysteine O-methyltransferase Ste14
MIMPDRLKVSSLAGYLTMVGSLLVLLFTGRLFSRQPAVIAVQAAALLLFLWARITFGRRSYHVAANPTEGGLVTIGPYKYIRHPIYAGMCLFTWAGVLAHWSWTSAICGVVMLAAAILRIFAEEKLVTSLYPQYTQYAANTWRMVPYIF